MNANDTRSQLREQRAQNRLAIEQIRGKRIEAAKLRAEKRAAVESLFMYDWVGPYAELLSRSRLEPHVSGPTSKWHRDGGRNWPLFQNEQELSILRAPSRLLEATNDYAQRLAAGVIAYGVGTGYTHRVAKKDSAPEEIPDALADACQAIVDELHERTDWFGGEQPPIEAELWARSMFDGEFFLCHFLRSDGTIDVRTVEPEQVTAPIHSGINPRCTTFGILTPERDPQDHLEYWVQWGATPADGEWIPRDRMTHLRRNVKRSIKRGMPDFCFGTLDGFDLAGKLRTNLADTAAQQAAIVAIMQHETATQAEVEAVFGASGTDSDYSETDPLTGNSIGVKRKHRPGELHVPKGQAYVNGPTAQNSPIHIQVLQACLRGAGGRWQPPEWMVSGDGSNNNYASALVTDAPFVKVLTQQQPIYGRCFRRTDWLAIKHWCDVHGGIVAKGKLWPWETIKKHLDIIVEGPSPTVRNKLEEAQQAAIEIPLGVDSRQRYMQSQGRDSDQIGADNSEWEDAHGSQGQPLPLPGEGGMESLLESRHRDTRAGDIAVVVKSMMESILKELRECGGEGGKPGPCADKGGGGSAKVDTDALGDLQSKLGDDAKKPGAWEKIKAVHARVKEAATAALVKIAATAHEFYPEILDTADDWMKLTMAKGHDALAAHTGIGANTAAIIASHVLARATMAIKRKLAGESEQQPDFEALAAHVVDLLAAIHEGLGIEFTPPDAGEIESALKAKVQARKE